MRFMVDFSSWISCQTCHLPVSAHGYQFDIRDAPELKSELIEKGIIRQKFPCEIDCQCGAKKGMEIYTLERLATVVDFGDQN